MRLRETAKLGHEAGKGVFIYPVEEHGEEEHRHPDAPSEDGDGIVHEIEKQEVVSSPEPQPISRQAPLMLDWHSLYRGRSTLEQRWRDPEGEPKVLRIDGHRDRWVIECLLLPQLN